MGRRLLITGISGYLAGRLARRLEDDPAVDPLARLFGFPHFPITPFFPWLGPLGVIPLPSKWIVEFGRPIPTGHVADDAWEDPITVLEMTDRVREEIQLTLRRNLRRRRSVFS